MTAESPPAMPLMPVIFVSHGPPSILLMETPVRSFLEQLGRQIPRPDSILCISAHWEATRPTVSAGAQPGILYDFGGPLKIDPEKTTDTSEGYIGKSQGTDLV